ncbi:hypothetical protein M758_4G080700 [Ceratodon purpureus]|nr:hypothetical protein M758_4G080700 [Ceratodon purpureus]
MERLRLDDSQLSRYGTEYPAALPCFGARLHKQTSPLSPVIPYTAGSGTRITHQNHFSSHPTRMLLHLLHIHIHQQGLPNLKSPKPRHKRDRFILPGPDECHCETGSSLFTKCISSSSTELEVKNVMFRIPSNSKMLLLAYPMTPNKSPPKYPRTVKM